VPESEAHFRTKDELAVEIILQARKQGLKFGWVGADAGYGKSAETFYRLAEMEEKFFIDVPSDFSVYLADPQPTLPPPGKRGRPARQWQSSQTKWAACRLQELADAQAWKGVRARATTRGQLELRAWRRAVYVWDPSHPAGLRLTLLVTENPDGTDRKYTLTNAPEATPLKRLVYAQRQRYWVERVFEDAKGQCGMADYQVQKWSGWHHHMALVMMAMLFMLAERIEQGDSYPLLSCADIETLLARFLPRRDLDEAEVIRQVAARHRYRQKAIESHARQGKERQNRDG
jgi:SRSO17 transposase